MGVIFAIAGIFFFARRSSRRRKAKNVGSSPPSSYRGSIPQARRSANGFFVDMEDPGPQNPGPAVTRSNRRTDSTFQSATIDTSEIFPPITPKVATPVVIPSSGLSSNPVTGTFVQADGSVKTVIKPLPSIVKAKEVTISPRKNLPKIQTTDLIVEEKAGEIYPAEWPDKLNKEPPPLAFDMVGRGEDGKAEKTKTLLLEHKPGGRWSDPFTVAWRGSGEADDGGNRWKSALSWVKDQNGRLEDPDTSKEKTGARKSRLSLA